MFETFEISFNLTSKPFTTSYFWKIGVLSLYVYIGFTLYFVVLIVSFEASSFLINDIVSVITLSFFSLMSLIDMPVFVKLNVILAVSGV